MLPIHSMFGSFRYGPEAVLVAFMIPVFILWIIGIAAPGCGRLEQMAYGLLRLYGRILLWPFRWLGRQLQAVGNRALQALGRLAYRLARVTAFVVSWPLRWLAWQSWEMVRGQWADFRRRPFVPHPAPLVLPPPPRRQRRRRA